MKAIDKLANPVWHSLNEKDEEFSISFGRAKFFLPQYCPFGATESGQMKPAEIDHYAGLSDNFYIVGNQPLDAPRVILQNELVTIQMVLTGVPKPGVHHGITRLNGSFDAELFKLVNLVQPGFFGEWTSLMGDYFGIFEKGRLVAATGERMKMDGFTEISAVVTHPDFTGRGFGKRLVAHTAEKVLSEGCIPFLHVNEKNSVARKLYENLGFAATRSISFWNLVKSE